jgi:UDP-N-acetylglucosamine:LPS N-acetylglucosamine transferase
MGTPLKPNKILLCISDTGGGHRSAANAVRNAIDELMRSDRMAPHSIEVVITDVVEKSNVVNKLFVGIYNYLLRYRQDWMKYYYSLIEFFKPDNSLFGYWLASAYVKDLLRKVNPLIVVSLHPMANHYLARALNAVKLPGDPKLIVVVTDPNANLWTGWACRDASMIIAPNDLAQQRLLSLGVEAANIVTIGMPVDPEFLHTPLQSREAFLTGVGLKSNLVTVCLSAGWAGGGNVAKIYKAMAKVCNPVQVIVICGNNTELLNDIKQQAQTMPWPTAVVPNMDSLSDAMSACALLVTKAGGLTTYEAVARRLPMAIDMLSEPMPQESGTAEMLIDAGLAKPIKQPSDIVAIVESTKHIDHRETLTLPTKYSLNRTDSVYEIARIILSSCNVLPNTDREYLNENLRRTAQGA